MGQGHCLSRACCGHSSGFPLVATTDLLHHGSRPGPQRLGVERASAQGSWARLTRHSRLRVGENLAAGSGRVQLGSGRKRGSALRSPSCPQGAADPTISDTLL